VCDAFGVEAALVGEAAHQRGVGAAGADRLAVDEDEAIVVEHPGPAVEGEAIFSEPCRSALEPRAGLRLAQHFAERAAAQRPVGERAVERGIGELRQTCRNPRRSRDRGGAGVAVAPRVDARRLGVAVAGVVGDALEERRGELGRGRARESRSMR
jgi:hypothetical protein